nr:hypothetical protein [uncultured bacterium]
MLRRREALSPVYSTRSLTTYSEMNDRTRAKIKKPSHATGLRMIET